MKLTEAVERVINLTSLSLNRKYYKPVAHLEWVTDLICGALQSDPGARLFANKSSTK